MESLLRPEVWKEYLADDRDKDYILDGITNGFRIFECDDNQINSYEIDNYSSAENASAKAKLDTLLSHEIDCGKITLAADKPKCIHAYGAVPKKDSDDLRPITDCSRPFGRSLNDNIDYKRMRYKTVDDAARLITPGCYMASVDISKAYRSVPVFPGHRKYQGLKWMFGPLDKSKYKYYEDNFLCFGCSSSPGIFTRLSDAIRRIMKRFGYKLILNYIDDYIVFGKTREECLNAQHFLISLLIKLGFAISWHKVVGPVQSIVWLGLTLDSISMSISMPNDKVSELKNLLQDFLVKKKAKKRELQRLGGKLAFASTVVKAGRTFSRRVIDLVNSVKYNHYYIRLNNEFRKDVEMWLSFLLDNFNGSAKLLKNVPINVNEFGTDSSFSGYGCYYNGDWLAGSFQGLQRPLVPVNIDVSDNWVNYDAHDSIKSNINALELIPVLQATRKWGKLWRNHKVIVNTDNLSTFYYVNKGTCKSSPIVMSMLRELALISAVNNFHLVARHVPGCNNVIADCLSRLNEPNKWFQLLNFTRSHNLPLYFRQYQGIA